MSGYSGRRDRRTYCVGQGDDCAARGRRASDFNYLDSGALYRLVALRALQDGIATEDAERLSAVAAAIAPSFAGGRIALDGKDVTDAIRSEDVSQFASRIAVLSGVRQALLELAAFPTQAARPRGRRARHGYGCFSRGEPQDLPDGKRARASGAPL